MSNDRQKLINRTIRRLALIEENAKQATPGPWGLSHSHVIKHGAGPNGKVVSFDIAMAPFERRQSVYGVNPYPTSGRDMRHIATCEPQTMLSLVADLRELLNEVLTKEQ